MSSPSAGCTFRNRPRRCLELVGFSYHAWKDPKALHTWLYAGGGKAEYEAYQNKFRGKRLNEDLRCLPYPRVRGEP